MQLLEAAGYASTRAAASLGVFDVIGIGPTDIVLVQVKTRDWPSADEVERLKLFRAPANARTSPFHGRIHYVDRDQLSTPVSAEAVPRQTIASDSNSAKG